MGLVDRINSRLDVQRAADPVTIEEFGYLLGQQGGNKSLAGVSVTPTRALGITAWYSGCRYLAETVSSLPCFTFRDTRSGRSRRADPDWKKRPDVDVPWASWVEFQMMSLLHRGDGFSFKLRNGFDQVNGLRSLHPDRVRVGRHPDTGRKVFQVRDMEPLFTSREILHIPGLSYDGLRGIDVIRYHAGSLGTTAAADEYAARFFDAGSHLNHYIQLRADLTREQAIEQREQFQAFHRGLQNAHELGLLGGDATLKTVGLDPSQTQLLETRKFGIIQVAQILRIPPHKLYELGRATYNNVEQQQIEFLTETLVPWITRLEQEADAKLLGPYQRGRIYSKLKPEALLRGDLKSRYDAYAVGKQWGWLSTNDIRALEDMDPIPEGGDIYLIPMNMRDAAEPPESLEAPEPEVETETEPEAPQLTEVVMDRWLNVLKAIQPPAITLPPIHITLPSLNWSLHQDGSQITLQAPAAEPASITVEGAQITVESPIQIESPAAPDVTVNIAAPPPAQITVESPIQIDVAAPDPQPAAVTVNNLQAPPAIEFRPAITVEAAPAPDVVVQLGDPHEPVSN